MIWDQLSLQIAFLLAYMLRNGLSNPYSHLIYCNVAFILVVIDAGVLLLFESLKNVLKRGYYQEFAMTVKHVILVVLVTTFYLFYIKRSEDYSRLALLYMTVLYLLVSYLTRILWKDQLKRKMRSSMKRSLLIITTKSMLDTVVYNIRNFNYEMFHVAGVAVIDCDMVGHDCGDSITVVANADTVADYVCREWVDEVFVNLPDDAPYPETLLNQLTEMGAVVHMKLAKTSNLIGEKKFVERLGIYTVLTTSINYATTKQLFMKRALDILGGLVGCLITLILTVILGPLIYIQSPGPIFFSQVRVGKNGKKFKIYKFRSMYMDAEERKAELMSQNKMEGLMFKMDYDPRIIGSEKKDKNGNPKGIGNFIRKTSLDEFPQFWNVLKGDMSLVGTRPPTVDEWEKYELHHRSRMSIKPGITGMWQASGRSDITDFEEVVKLDTEYIENWSIGLDCRILLKTVRSVVKSEGSV